MIEEFITTHRRLSHVFEVEPTVSPLEDRFRTTPGSLPSSQFGFVHVEMRPASGDVQFNSVKKVRLRFSDVVEVTGSRSPLTGYMRPAGNGAEVIRSWKADLRSVSSIESTSISS